VLVFVILYLFIAGPALILSAINEETPYFDQAFRATEQPDTVPLEGLPTWILPHEPVTLFSLRLLLIVSVIYVLGLIMDRILAAGLAKMLIGGTAQNLRGLSDGVPPRLLNDLRLSVALAMLAGIAVLSSYVYLGLNIPSSLLRPMSAASHPIFLPIVTIAVPLIVFGIVVGFEFMRIRKRYKARKYL
jgi:hypothetical protein